MKFTALTSQCYCLCAYSSVSVLYCKYQAAYTFYFFQRWQLLGNSRNIRRSLNSLLYDNCPCLNVPSNQLHCEFIFTKETLLKSSHFKTALNGEVHNLNVPFFLCVSAENEFLKLFLSSSLYLLIYLCVYIF